MGLSLSEQQLLTDFRQLSPDQQNELLMLLAGLKRKEGSDYPDVAPANQCALKNEPEKHPEQDSDQIFTE
ncbi:hypothetical protein OR1_01480 [Geobacter sp. OR-1]|uniref:hypothetical protein n=1 Tax=Geobacter sp. OR-1 TaxID=1266765 RepID=UPI000542010A|nr:hypothetical protein [Geobacter sp. OR-1]GAM09206.1 hypothetical protein OR1_01480 [Geobacter sp. OR-1]